MVGHGMKLRLAYSPMIPKADGDHLGQRPLSVLPVVYRLWVSLRAWTSAGVGCGVVAYICV